MNFQAWFLNFTCFIIIFGVLECREYLSSNKDAQVEAGCVLPSRRAPKCEPRNKASCTINNCIDQCNVNCCNGIKRGCTIPTCQSCSSEARTAICNADTARMCAGITIHNTTEPDVIHPNSQTQVPQLGAGCSTLPSKCTKSTGCTLKTCGDQCKANCCNGSYKSKCTIPTCSNCKSALATDSCQKTTASKCSGINAVNHMNGIVDLSEILDQFEELEIDIEIRGSIGTNAQQMLLEDVDLIDENDEH